jgi:hypothetical protein
VSVSPLDIQNRALAKLGQAPLRSVSDNNTAARFMLANYDLIRQAELRINFWNFAMRRVYLSNLVDGSGNAIAPAFGFNFIFNLPADCLRVAYVNDIFNGIDFAEYRNLDDSEYKIEGRTIVTSFSSPLQLRYVADVADTSQYDSYFVESLAWRIAAEGCETITQSLQKASKMDAGYLRAINLAKSSGAMENPPQAMPDNTWIMSRTSSGI